MATQRVQANPDPRPDSMSFQVFTSLSNVPGKVRVLARAVAAWAGSIVATGIVLWLADLLPSATAAWLAAALLLVTGSSLMGFLVLRPLGRAYAAEFRALATMASEDPLTGLLNRRQLEQHLQRSLARAERSGELSAVLYLDLDGFKQINDRHGHAFGDSVLLSMAERLRDLTRKDDMLFRVGGDEFVLLIQSLGRSFDEAQDRARAAADKLLERVRQPIDVDSQEVVLTCSIGVCLVGDLPAEASMIMRAADTAMYQAKRSGRDQIVFSDELGVSWYRIVRIGCAEIDDDHRRIESLLQAALQDRLDPVARLREAIDATRLHLDREEQFAAREGLDMTPDHIEAHRRLEDLMEAHAALLDEDHLVEIQTELLDAIRDHVLQYDTRLVAGSRA